MARVLIVDDARFMRHLIKEILEEAGHEIIGEGNDGDIGFNLYKELKPDITMLDITLPTVSGTACLEKIMAFDKNAKVIMCSALGPEWLIIEALQKGAKDFIVKPFKKKHLIETFNKVLTL